MRNLNGWKPRYVILERAEGFIEETGNPVVSHGFKEANRILVRWSLTAPDDGTYDKTDFVVVFNNGETYRGRYDLQRRGEDGEEGHFLERHIAQFLDFLLHYCNHWTGKEKTKATPSQVKWARKVRGHISWPVIDRFWCCEASEKEEKIIRSAHASGV